MNWPFLTLTARPEAPAATQQVGLAAQEGRDLEHVDDLGDRRRPARSRGRRSSPARPSSSLTSARICSACVEPDRAERGGRGAVGLVEARLEDERRCRGASQMSLQLAAPPRTPARGSRSRTGRRAARARRRRRTTSRREAGAVDRPSLIPGRWAWTASCRRSRPTQRPPSTTTGAVRNAFLRCSSSEQRLRQRQLGRHGQRRAGHHVGDGDARARLSTSSSARRMSPSVTKPARPLVGVEHADGAVAGAGDLDDRVLEAWRRRRPRGRSVAAAHDVVRRSGSGARRARPPGCRRAKSSPVKPRARG